jgi:hypothetical protein
MTRMFKPVLIPFFSVKMIFMNKVYHTVKSYFSQKKISSIICNSLINLIYTRQEQAKDNLLYLYRKYQPNYLVINQVILSTSK